MAEEQMKKEDQLFIHLVNTFVQSAWISLGKVKSPVSDKLERNLEQATYYIDLLDMLQTKMKGNLSEWEEQYIICLLYTSPSPRDLSTSRMPSSA